MPAAPLRRGAIPRPAALAALAAAAMGATALGPSTAVEPAAAEPGAAKNLVRTASFELGTAGWRANDGRVAVRETKAAPFGDSVARVRRGKGNEAFSIQMGFRHRPQTQAGAAYVARAWVRAGRRHTTGKPLTMILSLRNALGQRVKRWSDTRPLARGAFRQLAVNSGRVPGGHTLSVRLLQGDAVRQDRFEVDGVSLTKRPVGVRPSKVGGRRKGKAGGAALRRKPAGPPPAPDPRNYLFTGDFETGDFSQWHQVNYIESYQPKRIQLVSDIVRQGRYAARFEVRPGDKTSSGNSYSAGASGERAEIAQHWGGVEAEGESYYYSFSMYLPPDWIQEQDGYRIPLQFHSVDKMLDGYSPPPPLSIDFLPRGNRPNGVGNGGLYLELHGGDVSSKSYATGTKAPILPLPVQTGVWHDFVMYVHWHRSGGDVKIWHRTPGQPFTLRTEVTDRPNILYWSGGASKVFMRQGMYRRDASTTTTLYLDATTRSQSFAAAAAAMP